ncbi:MAG: HIT family protein [Bacteroidales bacterium]|nr:HIT family protein [Bacteroidales bacterium]
MTKAAPCPFCLPAVNDTAFMESRNFLAIYNIAPVLPGHTLVIPKKHFVSIMHLSEDELNELVNFCRLVTRLLEYVFKTTGFDWTLQEKPEAGQTIDHLHLHIIPRFKDDLPDPGDWYPMLLQNHSMMIDSLQRPRHTSAEMSQIVKKLRAAVSYKHPLYSIHE